MSEGNKQEVMQLIGRAIEQAFATHNATIPEIEAKQKETCTFPHCTCPIDLGPEDDWCAKGLPK